MVPKPGEPGSETWPAEGDAWQRGGGNCWITPTFDPDLDRLYFNTGNPCPDFDGAVREGDNLFTDSVVAVNPDTGQILDHYQYTPHDVWDYDSTMENILFDLDGQKLSRALRQERVPVHPRPHGLLAGPVVPSSIRITWARSTPTAR